ncbi:MAG: Gx transporter family protein [Mariprofundales bacterium]
MNKGQTLIIHITRPSLQKLQNDVLWLALLALAVALHVLESSLPSLGPWMKLGLANIAILLAFSLLGLRAMIALAFLRVIIGSMFIGSLFTPTMLMSFAGSIAAISAIIILHRLVGVSLIGLSLVAAVSHMLAQFTLVHYAFIKHDALLYFLPPLLLASCISGLLNGYLAQYLVSNIKLKLRYKQYQHKIGQTTHAG